METPNTKVSSTSKLLWFGTPGFSDAQNLAVFHAFHSNRSNDVSAIIGHHNLLPEMMLA